LLEIGPLSQAYTRPNGLAVIAPSRWIEYNDATTTEFVKYLRTLARACTQLAEDVTICRRTMGSRRSPLIDGKD
jgi:hypothetical protein